MNPAARAIAVANAAPIFILGSDLKWHIATFEHPIDTVRKRGAAPYITLDGFERDKARQGEIGHGSTLGRAGGCCDNSKQCCTQKRRNWVHLVACTLTA